MQATCYPNLDEMRLTCDALLARFLPPKTATFAVVAKRRFCNTLKTQQIIDVAAASTLKLIPDCKVNLDNPEATIVVEICKSICGFSVVHDYKKLHNFNLAVAREKKGENDLSSRTDSA